MDTKNKTRLPEVGEYVRGAGTLVDIQEIVPPPPPINKDYIFEEITARIELRLGSERLQKIATLWDFHGKEASVKGAIDHAKAYASVRQIGPNSDLEVVVVRVSGQVRKRPSSENNLFAPEYAHFTSLEWGSEANLPDPVETVVWSSRNPQ